MTASKSYDMIIVGGGLVGTSLIAALQCKPLKIALLEQHLPDFSTKTKRDSRPISLSVGSVRILKTMGIWTALEKFASPINTVHVSEQGRLGRIRFEASDYEVPALGFVVPFDQLQKALYHRISSLDNVDVISIQQIDTLVCDENGATVNVQTVEGDRSLHAALLVGADGSQSTCRQLMSITADEKNHGEIALTASFTIDASHQHIAYERFTERGTLAILPLGKTDQCRLVWTMTEAVNTKVSAWSDAQCIAHIQQVFGHRLGCIQTFKKGAQFPLTSIIANEQIRDAFVLLGNAAHTIYPLAAQGFNLGLRDVAVLSDVIDTALSESVPIGNKNVLQQYFDWRSQDQRSVIRFTNSLVDVFGLQVPCLGGVRGLAMLAMEVLPFAKKRIAHRAMGLEGRLPRLALGIPLS